MDMYRNIAIVEINTIVKWKNLEIYTVFYFYKPS